MSAPDRLLAEFATHDQLVAALRQLREQRCSELEVFTPFPSEEVDELLPGKPTPIGWLMLAGGFAGGGGAYFLQWFAARDYPYNVGGRPLHSWPAFVPVTFELTVLSAALVGLCALLWFTRLPQLHHPVFEAPEFARASQDRFFLAIRTGEPQRTRVELERLLRACGALSIRKVPP